MKKLKQTKGITLVALILTIVILLILAIVTINSIQGEGIIAKAMGAREKYEGAADEEQGILDKYLKELQGISSGTSQGGSEEENSGGTSSGDNSNVENDSSTNEGGSLEGNGSETQKILNFDSITAINYGDTIEYSAGGVTDWKVFYKDDSNLYIIASGYLKSSMLPTSLNMYTYSDTNYQYNTSWSNTMSSVNITETIADKFILNWWKDNQSIRAYNVKPVGDLLNTTAWSDFAGGIDGAEAIGSPTIEMWVASWNGKSEALGKDKYQKLYTEYDSNGYYIDSAENSKINDKTTVDLASSTIGRRDALYFPYKYEYNNCLRILVGFSICILRFSSNVCEL